MRLYRIPKSEIVFASKSGFLTKKIWDDFFNQNTQGWSSIRWKSFKSKGLFLEHPSKLTKNCLIPNPKSPEIIKLSDGEVSSPPAVTQIYHDEIVTTIVLSLKAQSYIRDYFLEPELRRIYSINCNSKGWEKRKLPDAVFDLTVNGKTKRTALEVELTRKNKSRYHEFFDKYSQKSKIEQVFVAYSSETIKSHLQSALKSRYYLLKERPFFFFKIDQRIGESFLEKIADPYIKFNIPKSS